MAKGEQSITGISEFEDHAFLLLFSFPSISRFEKCNLNQRCVVQNIALLNIPDRKGGASNELKWLVKM